MENEWHLKRDKEIINELWIRASGKPEQNSPRHQWHFWEEKFQDLCPRILEKAGNSFLQEGVSHYIPKPGCRKSVITFNLEREESKQKGISQSYHTVILKDETNCLVYYGRHFPSYLSVCFISFYKLSSLTSLFPSEVIIFSPLALNIFLKAKYYRL